MKIPTILILIVMLVAAFAVSAAVEFAPSDAETKITKQAVSDSPAANVAGEIDVISIDNAELAAVARLPAAKPGRNPRQSPRAGYTSAPAELIIGPWDVNQKPDPISLVARPKPELVRRPMLC